MGRRDDSGADVIREIARNGGPPLPDLDLISAWSIEDKVKYFYARNWTKSRIAQQYNLSPAMVQAIIGKISEEILDEIASSPDHIRARHIAFTEQAAMNAMDMHHKTAETRPDPRWIKTALMCLSDRRKINGLDAPTRTINTDMRGMALVKPEEMQRVLSNPKAMEALLAFEEAVSEGRSQPLAIDVTPRSEGGS